MTSHGLQYSSPSSAPQPHRCIQVALLTLNGLMSIGPPAFIPAKSGSTAYLRFFRSLKKGLSVDRNARAQDFTSCIAATASSCTISGCVLLYSKTVAKVCLKSWNLIRSGPARFMSG